MPPTNAPLNTNNNDPPPPPQQQKDLRPPLYNPEDYASALRALFSNTLSLPHTNTQITPTSLILEHTATNPPVIPGQGLIDMNKHGTSQYHAHAHHHRNNNTSTPEMGMKKFINGSELLFKLEADLRSAFPTFTQEFVSGDSEGVTCILDALRTIHEALDHVNGLREQRKLVLDERSCIQCLYLMMRNLDTIGKLLSYPHGLYSVVSCCVSTNTSTRVIALEILTAICEQGGSDGFAKISEGFSTLRLRLGEPVRFKVLVGAVSSAAAGVFQAAGVRFFKSFVGGAGSSKVKVYLQVELEEAGFRVDVMRKSAELSPARESRLVLQELEEWDRVIVDVDTVVRQNSQLRNSVATLQQEIATLKDKIKKQEPVQQVVYATPSHSKYTKKNKQYARQLSSTPIQTITTPVDSEEEAEQIHQILEDLHNIVNNEMLNDQSSSTTTTATNSDIVPVLNTRPLGVNKNRGSNRAIRSEPNLFESSGESNHNGGCGGGSGGRVKDVVQQLENSSVLFNTLPNFNTGGLASKFANFKSSKLDGGGRNNHGWGDDDDEFDEFDENNGLHNHHERENLIQNHSGRGKSRVKSLENLDNFTLKWKYPVVEGGGGNKSHHQNIQTQQPNSLIVLQDYRMNRFGMNKQESSNNSRQSPSSGGGGSSSSGGMFSKKKKQLVHHPQKTFQISMVGGGGGGGGKGESGKGSSAGFNDLSSGGGDRGNAGSPSLLLERVTDLPSGMY